MSLKNNKFLKYFSILLFCLELLAPVFLYTPTEQLDFETRQKNIHDVSHQFNLLTFLLCEEAGNEEEREGRDHKACAFSFETEPLVFFRLPEKFEQITVQAKTSDLVAWQPSLVTLFHTYRI